LILEAYDVERLLAPSLRPGQVVVAMDTLAPIRGAGEGAHRGAEQLLLGVPAALLTRLLAFLRRREAFSKLKALLLRKAKARMRLARRTCGAGSATVGTCSALNPHEHRCQA
jgi:hypothetical protein